MITPRPRFSKSPAQRHLKARLLYPEFAILQQVLASNPSQSKGSHKSGCKQSQPGSLSSFTSPHWCGHHSLTIITNTGQIFMLSTNTISQLPHTNPPRRHSTDQQPALLSATLRAPQGTEPTCLRPQNLKAYYIWKQTAPGFELPGWWLNRLVSQQQLWKAVWEIFLLKYIQSAVSQTFLLVAGLA